MRQLRNLLGLSVVSLGILGWANPGHAVLMLELDNGSGGAPELTIVDNGVGDLDLTVGALVVSGAFGVFTRVLSAGESNATPPTLPAMLVLAEFLARSTGPGTVIATIIDTSFVVPTSSTKATAIINASSISTGASYSAQSFVNGVQLLNATGITTTASQSGSATVNIAATPYTINQIITVTTTAAGQSVNFDFTTTVPAPEPMTLALLGSGLVGLGLFARRRQTPTPQR